jgi:hypothetical protein
MIRTLLCAAGVAALTIGIASAQTTSQTTITQTTLAPPPPSIPAPPPAGYGTTERTERTTFGGASTEVEQSSRNLPGVSEASKRETVVHPDGTTETVTESNATRTPVPPPPPAWSSSTSTTTQTTTTR